MRGGEARNTLHNVRGRDYSSATLQAPSLPGAGRSEHDAGLLSSIRTKEQGHPAELECEKHNNSTP